MVKVGVSVGTKDGVGVMVTVFVQVTVAVKVAVGMPSMLIQASLEELLSAIVKLLKALIS
jgi:hypothetical protein